jgi:hypothetical protein
MRDGEVRRRTSLRSWKMAVLAPMPSASVVMAMMANIGALM